MSNESTKPDVGFSMRSIETPARRDADTIREQKEREQSQMRLDGRKLARRGRSENINFKTTAPIRKMLFAMAEAEGKTLTEIMEDAITLRDRVMRGQK